MSSDLQVMKAARNADDARRYLDAAAERITMLDEGFELISSEDKLEALTRIDDVFQDIQDALPLTAADMHKEYDALFKLYEGLHARVNSAVRTVLPRLVAASKDDLDADASPLSGPLWTPPPRSPTSVPISPFSQTQSPRSMSPLNLDEDSDDEEHIDDELDGIRASGHSDRLDYLSAKALGNLIAYFQYPEQDRRGAAKRSLDVLANNCPIAQPLFEVIPKEEFFEEENALLAQFAVLSLFKNGEIVRPSLGAAHQLKAINTLLNDPDLHSTREPVSSELDELLGKDTRGLLEDLYYVIAGFGNSIRDTLKSIVTNLADNTPSHMVKTQFLPSLKDKLDLLENSHPAIAKPLFAILPKKDFLDEEHLEKAKELVAILLD